MSVQLTDPINFPTGDRRTVAVRPLASLLLDPLYDPARDGVATAPPLDVAARQARRVLAQHQTVSIHDHTGLIGAATGLEVALRHLVAAMDAEVQA
ncbi:hypothetical protein [Streptomyces sp. LN549]|uniref:hypothetical protein n=1 Tax=Streptomyces sp. LN549 TaxID=3112979 RepID=UPI0037228910